MTVKFDNSAYLRSHGKNPSGTGMWAFATQASGEDAFFSPTMSLSEAKRWAKKQVGPECRTLFVLP